MAETLQPTDPPPAVTAVISTHDRCTDLMLTLRLLLADPYPCLHIIVADNASEDDTRRLLRSGFPGVTLVENPVNDPLRGYNLAFHAAQTPFVLVLDDDSCPAPGTISAMVAKLLRTPQAALAAANIVGPAGESEWGPDATTPPTDDWASVIGCGFLARREALLAAGGYDEAFRFYYNDTDLALRCLGMGWRVAYDPSWIVHHRKPAASRLSPLKLRMMLRNFTPMLRAHTQGRMRLDLWLGHTAIALSQALRCGCLWTGLRGLIEGLSVHPSLARHPLPPSPARERFLRSCALSWTLRRLAGQDTPDGAFGPHSLPGDADLPAEPVPARRNRLALHPPRLDLPLEVPRVAAAIVTHNKREAVLTLLARLREVDVPAFVTVNACTDGTLDAIRARFPNVTALESGENLGGTGGFNCATLAALASGARYIVLIDDDALPDPDCLDTLAGFLDARPEYVFAVPSVYIAGSDHVLQETGGDVDFARPVPVQAWNRFLRKPDLPDVLDIGYASACLFMVRASAVARTGVMDWNYFIFSDDVDWSLRLRASGGRAACVTAAHAWHDFPWAKPFSPMRLYYFHRNGLYLLSRLRRGDRRLVSVRHALARLFRSWWIAAAGGDQEIAATLRRALGDAWRRSYGRWSRPIPFPFRRARLSGADFASCNIRRVLLNIRIEDFDKPALEAIRAGAGTALTVDVLCDPHRVEAYRAKGLFTEVIGRERRRAGQFRQFLALRRRRYDLVVTDAFMDPRGPNDMVGRFGAFYHDGALWDAACHPWRALAASALAPPLASLAARVCAHRFARRPPDGVPPSGAHPLLERLGVNPAVGQPWARPWPLPFLAPATTAPRTASRRLADAVRRAARRLLAGARLAHPLPVEPPPLRGGEQAGGYWAWCKARGPVAPARYDVATLRSPPLFSVIVPVCDPPEPWLHECIRSVRAQRYDHWELVLVDDASQAPYVSRVLKAARRSDRRIRVTRQRTRSGISAATNAGVARASGAWLVFLDHDDILDPFCLPAFAQAAAAATEAGAPAGVLYGDEDRFDDRRECFWAGVKPDFSPDKLLATNYVHHPVAIRRALFAACGGLRSAFDGSQDHDLLLRAAETGARFLHVPDVLYHMRVHAGSLASGARAKPQAHERDVALIREAVRRRGWTADVEPIPGHEGFHVIRRAPPPGTSVSVLLAGAPGREAAAGWNGADVLHADATLPLAAALNAIARKASADVLVIAASTVTPDPGYAERLAAHALRPELGLVTGKLVFADGTLYACGLVLGPAGGVSRWHIGCNAADGGYGGWMQLDHEVSAVPWQLFAVRRTLLAEAGGFDESYGDGGCVIDLALRLGAERRLRHLAVPAARALVPGDAASAPPACSVADLARLHARWSATLRPGDPFYNPNLTLYNEGVSFLDAQEQDLRLRGVLAPGRMPDGT